MKHILDVAKDLSALNTEASKQAMRCIANAILLVPAGRDTLVDLEGDEFCTRVYIVSLQLGTTVCGLTGGTERGLVSRVHLLGFPTAILHGPHRRAVYLSRCTTAPFTRSSGPGRYFYPLPGSD